MHISILVFPLIFQPNTTKFLSPFPHPHNPLPLLSLLRRRLRRTGPRGLSLATLRWPNHWRGTGLRLSALVKLKSHPQKGIYSCLVIEIFQFSSIEIFQFSSSFPAPVIPYISYSTPTTMCGSHVSYSTSISMKAPTPSPSLSVLSPQLLARPLPFSTADGASRESQGHGGRRIQCGHEARDLLFSVFPSLHPMFLSGGMAMAPLPSHHELHLYLRIFSLAWARPKPGPPTDLTRRAWA
jgi:hypothetical protein